MKTLFYSLSLSTLFFVLPTVAELNHNESIELLIFKSPSCGCCTKWVEHISEMEFTPITKDINANSNTKAKYQIAPEYRSCHTAVTRDGYAFEGHVPAKYIKQFLKEQPDNSIGLAVPGMPIGTPGMEAGERFQPYQVLILFKDGTNEVYADILTYSDQF